MTFDNTEYVVVKEIITIDGDIIFKSINFDFCKKAVIKNSLSSFQFCDSCCKVVNNKNIGWHCTAVKIDENYPIDWNIALKMGLSH